MAVQGKQNIVIGLLVRVLIVLADDVKIMEESRSSGYYQESRLGPVSTCAVFQTCLPMSQCLDGTYEVARACLLVGDRSSVCGYTDHEPLICCNRRVVMDSPDSLQQYNPPQLQPVQQPGPPSFQLANPTGLNNGMCGRSLVQAQIYRGLGAFPFVARIGFKSK